MPLAATAPRSRLTATKARQPVASSSASSSATSSVHPTSTSVRSRPANAAPNHSVPSQPPPLILELPPSLPTLSELEASNEIKPSPQLIARRLISLARSFLALNADQASQDPLDSEIDLCSATFFSIYAVCLDPSSTVARSTLARCARHGGFNIVLPFSPSASAASAIVSASRLSSQDPHDTAGAHACIHILQQGSAASFQDAASAREYRDACRTLGRPSDALEVAHVLRDKALGKRKAIELQNDDVPLPQTVSSQCRYQSQLQTDEAYSAASRGRSQHAQTAFIQALELDPFNWRAWAGLCDTGYGAATANKHLGASALDRLYSGLVAQVQAPYVAMESSMKSSTPFSTGQAESSTMIRKVSEDGANKKLKVSSDASPMPSLPSGATRNGASSRPIDNLTAPPLPTTSASAVTATRLHPASRALSAAQTNTHHLEPVAADRDDVKAAKVGGNATRPTRPVGVRTATVPPPTAANARQLRSTRGNAGVPTASTAVSRSAAAPNRAGATSATGSVSSTSSASSTTSMSSRATVSTARTAVSARRVASGAPGQTAARSTATKPTTASSARTAAGTIGSSVQQKRTTAAPTSRLATAGSTSRPGSAMSKASSSSAGGANTTVRSNGAFASSRTAAEAMRIKEESDARAKLDSLNALRESSVHQLTAMAHQKAADRYVLALLAQVGEAYRLLRLCEGDKAAAVLSNPILAGAVSVLDNKPQTLEANGEMSSSSSTVAPITTTEATRFLDLQIKDSLLHHLLLARSYAESSQYASSESHFTAVTKLNPYIASHMDIFSLVLFHLSREVRLSALAQHLSLISPSTASTHIVVGNAFSLQKEHQTALVCFQRAAASAPDYAYAYTLAGHEAHDLGMHDEAIAYFRSAIRCDRRHWNAWAGLGRVYLGIGEHEHAASKSLQQAIHINPSNHILWDLVGWTFSLLNAPAKALECYDRAIELAPGAGVLTLLRRAELLLQHGDAESSHRDLCRACEMAPEEASVHILLAQSYMRLGGGQFCHLEGGSGKAGRATGTMVLPTRYHAEITHHLSVAVDLDPTLLRLVKSICEGYKSLPGNKLDFSMMDSMVSGQSVDESGAEYSARGYDASAMANSTPHHMFQYGSAATAAGAAGMMHPPADFASTHLNHDAGSFLNTANSSLDIVLHDADVSL
ncbi:Anaphase-promoting complex subunit CDC27 [Pseudozyma hubeiensis]|nr:Anaphase-promoting complex subunit CDC27 [Pseudozyma hubeiensis]